MTECTFTGDILIKLDSDGDWDIEYINGQSCMTDGFETAVMLSVFGEPDTWQNGMTNVPSEKYISDFPEVIRNGNVNNETLNGGSAAIRRALAWMKDTGAAESVKVSGEIISVYGIGWTINISKGEIQSRYQINWDKGSLTAQGVA